MLTVGLYFKVRRIDVASPSLIKLELATIIGTFDMPCITKQSALSSLILFFSLFITSAHSADTIDLNLTVTIENLHKDVDKAYIVCGIWLTQAEAKSSISQAAIGLGVETVSRNGINAKSLKVPVTLVTGRKKYWDQARFWACNIALNAPKAGSSANEAAETAAANSNSPTTVRAKPNTPYTPKVTGVLKVAAGKM